MDNILEENYLTGDCMRICRFLNVDIFQYKVIKILVILIFCLHFAIFLVQSYLCLVNFNGPYFLTYAPVYFGTFMILVALMGNLILTPVVQEWLNCVKLWKIKNLDIKVTEKIEIQSKIITLYVIVNSVFAIATGFLHMFPTEEEKVIFFAYSIFEKYAPNYRDILSWSYGSSFLIFSLVLPSNCNQLVYASSHMRFQTYTLLEYMKPLKNLDGDEKDLELLYDEDFQKKVNEKLVIFGKRHSKILKSIIEVRNRMSIFIVLYALSAFALGLSTFLFFLLFEGDLSATINYTRLGVLSVTGTLTAVAALTSGQEVENMGQEIFSAICVLKWYIWNKNNKRIYSIIIANVINPFKFQFTEQTSINFELGARIGKALYSVLSVLSQLK